MTAGSPQVFAEPCTQNENIQQDEENTNTSKKAFPYRRTIECVRLQTAPKKISENQYYVLLLIPFGQVEEKQTTPGTIVHNKNDNTNTTPSHTS